MWPENFCLSWMLINVHIKFYAGFSGITNYTKKQKTNQCLPNGKKKKIVENIFTVLNVCFFYGRK